jgi:hypothetical protein
MFPQENVEIVTKAYADFCRGDIAAVMEALDDSIEWNTPGDGSVVTSGLRHGKAEVQEFFRSVGEAWLFESFEPREYVAQGDLVIAMGHYDMRSQATRRRVSSDWVMVWRFRDGKATHFQEYTDTLTLSSAMVAEVAA